MKWIKKIPEYNESRNNELLDDGWIPLKEPKSIGVMILISIPLMIIIGILIYSLIDALIGIDLRQYGFDFDAGKFSLDINPIGIIGLVVTMLFHEFLHLICIPNFVDSEKTLFGINVFYAFVYTEEMINRNRFLFIAITPLIMISIVLPIILSSFGLLSKIMVILIIINGLGSSVDMLNIIIVVSQVKKTGMIVSNGSRSYWKAIHVK